MFSNNFLSAVYGCAPPKFWITDRIWARPSSNMHLILIFSALFAALCSIFQILYNYGAEKLILEETGPAIHIYYELLLVITIYPITKYYYYRGFI